jgi:hypothetical protein
LTSCLKKKLSRDEMSFTLAMSINERGLITELKTAKGLRYDDDASPAGGALSGATPRQHPAPNRTGRSD